jgi:arsenical pump membrane protein
MMSNSIIWLISLLSITGVIIRPFKIPEAFWAISGAILLVVFGLISPSDGFSGVLKGLNVYLFLTGMMLLAEIAREEKLFDWLSAHATKHSKGSAQKLFMMIYIAGILVTIFLSNDATAIVLTPAVAAAMKSAKVEKPLPYLLICAFIANAASFVLPISNPANLVIYGRHIPSLMPWLTRYIIPSIVSIAITFLMLRFTQRKELHQNIQTDILLPELTMGGKTALFGIGVTAVILLIASAKNMQLGWPTAISGIVTATFVTIRAKKNPIVILKGISWSVLPLVAGLFVMVEALNKTGLITTLAGIINIGIVHSTTNTIWGSALSIALGCNLINNLPAALIAGNVIQVTYLPEMVKNALLIGVDLGPNLSITGSLSTILWLMALRREGQIVSAWYFIKLGAVIMVTALVFTIASLWI